MIVYFTESSLPPGGLSEDAIRAILSLERGSRTFLLSPDPPPVTVTRYEPTSGMKGLPWQKPDQEWLNGYVMVLQIPGFLMAW